MSQNNLEINKEIFQKIEAEIPPWALPKEEITLYVKLKKDIEFSKIIITLPKSLEIKDFINVVEHAQHDNIIEIFEIGKFTLSKKDYFGITIASIEPFDDLAVKSKISILLVERDGNVTEIETFARIFRPYLDIEKIPESISLNDVEETTLPIHLKFKGFGDISIRIECKIGGNLVSEGGRSVMDRLFHGFLREGLFDKNLEQVDEKGITIDKTKLVRAFDEIKTKLRDVEFFKELEKDKEITQEAIEWLKSFEDPEQKKFMNVLYDTMEGYMIKQLTDIFARNISRHLQIDSGTNIIAEIKAKLTYLHLKIFYIDLANNIYPQLEKTIKIIDKREKDSELRVVIPIEVEKVDESEAYKDVGAMVIQNVL